MLAAAAAALRRCQAVTPHQHHESLMRYVPTATAADVRNCKALNPQQSQQSPLQWGGVLRSPCPRNRQRQRRRQPVRGARPTRLLQELSGSPTAWPQPCRRSLGTQRGDRCCPSASPHHGLFISCQSSKALCAACPLHKAFSVMLGLFVATQGPSQRASKPCCTGSIECPGVTSGSLGGGKHCSPATPHC